MPITWMVLARDVSGTVSVADAERLVAVLILDVDTGLVRGAAIEGSRGKALKKAVGLALTEPAGDLPPGRPERVLCEHGQKSGVRTALFAAGAGGKPVIEEVQPGNEAEEIFDSLIDHLSDGSVPGTRQPGPEEPSLRLHTAGHDLVRPNTPVTIGHLSWPSVAELRKRAQVYRPAPPDAPSPAGREVPLVVLSPAPGGGPALAAGVAGLDPYGVSALDAPHGKCVVVLAGGSGAEVLMELPAGHSAIALFERRLQQTRGRQVILVAEPSSATGDGAIYGLFECHQAVEAPPAPKRQPRRRAAAATGTTRLRVTMRDVQPVVQRTVDVPAGATLAELHDVLQVALGWTNSHLHRFETDAASYARPDDEWDDDDELDDRTAYLSALPPKFTYVYDFGDNWEHDVEVLGARGAEPGCVSGQGACPPEDCGGASGYTDLLQALGDPRHREHREMTEWVGDRLRPFDLAATNALVRAVVGRVPGSVRMLLDLVGDGVKLTQAGRLPRALVRTVQEQRAEWFFGTRPANGEDDSPPLSALHELLRRVGILRLAKGVLTPTTAAGNDQELVRRVRSGYAEGSFDQILAERAVAQVVVRGPITAAELAVAVLPWIGDGWRRRDGEPIDEADVRRGLAYLSADLEGLDMIAVSRGQWSAGPSARTVLPGVAPIAELL